MNFDWAKLMTLQVFASDAVRLAEMMIAIQNSIHTADDPRSPYLIESE